MNQRGITLVELLVAIAVSVIVAIGIGTFYASMVRFHRESASQAYLQRQAVLVLEEMGRQIRAGFQVRIKLADDLDCAGPQYPNGTQLLEIDNGRVCFYRANDGRLCRDTGTGCWDMLAVSDAGKLMPLTAPTLTLAVPCAGCTTRVDITFRLSDGRNEPMIFQQTLDTRNSGS